MLVERQIPVLRLAQHGCRTAYRAVGVNQLRGAQARAAVLTLVAIGTLGVAVGTLAHDIAVGQECLGLLVVILLALLLQKLALVVERAEKVRRHAVVGLRRGAPEGVETDAEVFEAVADERVVAVHHLLHRAALLAGTQRDGHAMLVASADEEHRLALEAQIAHVDIGRHIHAGQVTNMHAAVGIRQGGRDQSSVEFLFHSIKPFIWRPKLHIFRRMAKGNGPFFRSLTVAQARLQQTA